MATPAHETQLGRGIALIVCAFSLFALVDTLAKYLARSYPVVTVVWARYAFQMLPLLVFFAPRTEARLIRSNRPRLQIVRALILIVSSLLFFSALPHMPLAAAASITFIAPILVAAASALFLRERVRPATWAALGACFAGVLMIMRPGSDVFTWWSVLPLVTACLFVVYQLMTRRLAGIDPATTTLFYPGLIGTIVLLPLAFAGAAMPHSAWDAAMFVSAGLVGGLGHWVLIKAYELAPPSALAPFMYFQIASVLVLGFVVFGEVPDPWALAGIAVIVTSGLFLVWRQRLPAPPRR